MSNVGSPAGQENEQSSSSPSDFEVFDYDETEEEFPYQRFNSGGNYSTEKEEEESGTPLNLELALLLNQGIVSKAKANFGISKNIETLEKSTIDLSTAGPSDSPQRKRPNGLTNGSSTYKRGPDLYLRRSEDDHSNNEDDEEEIDFVRIKHETASTKSPVETVFENGSTEQSPCVGGNFRFMEPTTSFHSAYGYDHERMMFEGIP